MLGLLGLGYVVGFPVVLWLRRDLRSFRRILWTGYGNREAWSRAAVVSYVLGGWPVLVIAATWRRCDLRLELIAERDDFRTARHERDPSERGSPSM